MIYTFVGGDDRQIEAMDILIEQGHFVKAYGFDKKKLISGVTEYDRIDEKCLHCDCLMLPIPCKNRHGGINFKYSDQFLEVKQIMDVLDESCVVILGKADVDFITHANKKGIVYFDILEEESFAILNAIPSAEGAIQRAMEKTNITLHGSSSLVLGYGRIGKVLSRMLKGIGAKVYVASRNQDDLAWIYENGYVPVLLEDLDSVIPAQDIIFNTIPHLILDHKRLSKVSKSTLIIDLASYPGGVDYEAAKSSGIEAYLELGLPGIVAPRTAGNIICQVTRELIERVNSNRAARR